MNSDSKGKVLIPWPRTLRLRTAPQKYPYIPRCSIKSVESDRWPFSPIWKHGEHSEKMATGRIKIVLIEQYGRYGYFWGHVENCNIHGHGVSTLYLKYQPLCRCTGGIFWITGRTQMFFALSPLQPLHLPKRRYFKDIKCLPHGHGRYNSVRAFGNTRIFRMVQ